MTDAGAERDAHTAGRADGSSESRSRLRFVRGLAGGSRAVLVLAVAAGLAMIAAEFLLVFSVDVGATSCEATASPDVSDFCATSGGERHSYALVLLGLFTLAMAWGATVGRSRPAGVALVLVGAVVLAIGLLGDLPDASSEGIIGTRYESASASPGLGLWLELVGGVLAAAAGALRLGRPS